MNQIIEQLERGDKSFIRAAQLEEKKHKKQIPKEFYIRIGEVEESIGKRIDELKEIVVVHAIKDHVIALYNILRDAGIEPKPARAIVSWRFVQFRSLKHIEKFLPEESKDLKYRELAKLKNKKQRNAKEKVINEGVDRYLAAHKMEPYESGAIGGVELRDKLGVKAHQYYKDKGKEGGEADREVDKAVGKAAIDLDLKPKTEEIIAGIQVSSRGAQKIREFWEKFPDETIYLKIDPSKPVHERVTDVYVQELPKSKVEHKTTPAKVKEVDQASVKKLENPIPNH